MSPTLRAYKADVDSLFSRIRQLWVQMHEWGLSRQNRCLKTLYDTHSQCKVTYSLPGYGTAIANLNNVLGEVRKCSRKYSLTFQYNGSKVSTILHFPGTDPWLRHWCGSCAKAAAIQRMQPVANATDEQNGAQNATDRCGRCVETQQGHYPLQYRGAEEKPSRAGTVVEHPQRGTSHNAPPKELCNQHYIEAIVLLRQWLGSAPDLDQSALVQIFLIVHELARSSVAQSVQYFTHDASRTDVAIHLQGAATLLGVMTAKLADKNLLMWFASAHKHFSDQLYTYYEPDRLGKRIKYGSLPGFCRCLRTSNEWSNPTPTHP